MTVQSDDGRLRVERWNGGNTVYSDLSEQQVFDALLPLLPPPPPTARDVAEAFLVTLSNSRLSVADRAVDLARRWDEGGRP